jgi:formylglycine-generating enzyme required for sulfatase activity
VGLRDDGLPDIVWVPVPRGTVRLEEIDHDFEVAPFEMARYPVTHIQFQAFFDAKDGWRHDAWWDGLHHSDDRVQDYSKLRNHPQETVDWYEAVAFCRWLDARLRAATPGAAWEIRLPTEWEWQQAATAGDPHNEYPWGRDWDTRFANSGDSQTRRATAVGMYPPGAAVFGSAPPADAATATPLRIDDLAGNVWEWCLNKNDDPQKPLSIGVDTSGALRVLRGGSWGAFPWVLRAAGRSGRDPGYRYGTGFRVCRVSPIGEAVRRRRWALNR